MPKVIPSTAAKGLKTRPLFLGAIFFSFFYFYLWLRLDPRLLYYNNPQLFLLDAGFFKNFLIYPGGIADYISRFIIEWCYFPAIGALIITVLAFLVSFSYSAFFRNIFLLKSASAYYLFFLVPFFLILNIYNRYVSFFLVGLFFVFVFFGVYIKAAELAYFKKNKIAVYFILSLIVYYFTNSAYWLFASLCSLWEIVKNRKCALGISYLIIEIFIYYISAEYIFHLRSISPAFVEGNILFTNPNYAILHYLFPFLYSPNAALRVSVLLILTVIWLVIYRPKKYIIFCLPVLILAIMQFWLEPLANKSLYAFFLIAPLLFTSLSTRFKDKFLAYSYARHRVMRGFFIVFFVAALLLIFAFNKYAHSSLKINYYSQIENWDGILKEAQKIPLDKYKENKFLYQQVFNALYNSGRLPYEEFDYPPAHLLFNMPYPRSASKLGQFFSSAEVANTCFKLGLINHAELMNYWALELEGDSARANKQLALIYILKDNKAAARVLLNKIKKSLIYRKWAERYLSLLDNDDLLMREPELALAQERMIKSDDASDENFLIQIAYKYEYEGVFKRLLRENKYNKMAFEYLMAYYLLMGQTEKIIANLSRLDDFGYKDIPLNYQEAILVQMFKTKEANINLFGRPIDKTLSEKYAYFDQVYRQYRYNKVKTLSALQGYPNSYFLYYISLTESQNDAKE